MMPIEATWMDLEMIRPSKSERERQISYITSMWNLTYVTNETFDRIEKNGLGEQTCGCHREGGGSGMDWESRVNKCKLLHLECV